MSATSPPAPPVGLAAVLDDLIPDPDDTERFEQAVKDLGEHLGFQMQRPEQETGDGPDVLWMLGELKYLVNECKSGVTTDFISRHDAAQLSHSVDWFVDNYDSTCNGIPMMIHKTNQLHQKATARKGMQVLTFDKLAELREAVRKFGASVASSGRYDDPDEVAARLKSFRLNASDFINTWMVLPHA